MKTLGILLLASKAIYGQAISDYPKDWAVVAHAGLIIKGKIEARPELLKGQVYSIQISVESRLKGECPDKIRLIYRKGASWNNPEVDLSGTDKEAKIFFVEHRSNSDGLFDQEYFAGEGYYLSALSSPWYDLSGIRPATSAIEKQVSDCIAFNCDQLCQIRADLKAAHFDSEQHVREAIDAVVKGQGTEQSLASLRSLGPESIPLFVRLMDDFRPLPETPIHGPSSLNPEGIVWHPKCVLDLLSILLHEKTGMKFEILDGKPSDEVRRRELIAWRLWVGRSPFKAHPRVN